jgi:hypothetical protein
MMQDATAAVSFEETGQPNFQATGDVTQDLHQSLPGFSDLPSHIQNAHCPPRLTEEERFALKVEGRRKFEAERRLRIFDAKRRTIGVDKETLDAQVAEKHQNDNDALNQKRRDLHDMKRQDRDLKILEAERANLKRAMEKDCKDHSLTYLHFAARSEYDLNDPKANRKELPARVGDNDRRCGPASMQQFGGEDLMKEERVRQQKEAMVNYIEQQRFEKAVLAEQGDGKEFLAELAELQALRNEMEDADMSARKDMRRDVRDQNKAYEEEKFYRNRQECLQSMAMNAAEIDASVNGPLLSENSQLYKKNGKVVRETYKGSTREERLAVAEEQHVQRAMDAQRKQQDKAGDLMGACEMEAARQVMIAAERHRTLDRRKAQMAMAQENLRLHEEQKQKTAALTKLYTNEFSQDFFAQFGKHTR